MYFGFFVSLKVVTPTSFSSICKGSVVKEGTVALIQFNWKW